MIVLIGVIWKIKISNDERNLTQKFAFKCTGEEIYHEIKFDWVRLVRFKEALTPNVLYIVLYVNAC